MFGFSKSKMGYGLVRNPASGDYDGAGIWYRCPDCETAHRIKQTPDFRELVEEQCKVIGQSSQALYEAFGISDPGGRWDVTPEQARFTFTHPDGRTCHARYGVIGSWNEATHSWMWAWQFPEDWMPAPAVKLSMELYSVGAACGWRALTEPLLYLDKHEAWHMTNLAAHVAGYPMVYSARVNDKNRHFFAIDRPVWLT